MNRLTQMIKEDMKPALGVTEPGAIAFAAAKARSYTHGPIESVMVSMNSGMYKNAFTCGIPNSNEVGNIFSAALGVVAGDCEKGLESLANVTPADNEVAQKLVDEGKIHVKLSGITSEIFIEATVKTPSDECVVTIKGSHTNIVRIVVNGKVEFEVSEQEPSGENLDGKPGGGHEIHNYTLAQLVDYAKTVPLEEILPGFSSRDFYDMEIGSASMMRGYMAYPCYEELTLEKKLRLFLMMSLKVYNVPEYETEQIVQFVGRLDIRSISEQVMQELFRELAMHFEFSLARLEAEKKEENKFVKRRATE